MRKELAVQLPENQMIQMTRLGQQLMPLLAILTVSLPIAMHLNHLVPSAIAMALLMLSLPVQGLFWLGKRSQTSLPLELKNWYVSIHHSLQEQEVELPPSKTSPTFYDLAQLLKQAYSRLDRFASS